jgi:16S rRNA (uracil1498-N3)-methyltransferase
MARRRFFVGKVRSGHAELGGDAAEHLRRVLRAERGQRFEISDNESVYLAEIDGFGKGRVSFRVIEKLEAQGPPARLILLASLIKFDRFEQLLEQATELGVETIVPIQAERSEKGLEKAAGRRLARWRRIVLESSQQSRRAHLPEVMASKTFAEALKVEAGYRYLLDESSGIAPILSVLPAPIQRHSSDTICLLAGPEGGWTDTERKEASTLGWLPVSLGPQILRTETAVVAALAVVSSAWYLGSSLGQRT